MAECTSASLRTNSGVSCRAIRKEMGLQGVISARQLKKKWGNMKEKYKVSPANMFVLGR